MASYTNLNNEIFAQNALESFVAELAPFSSFSTNFSPAPVQKGDQVLVPLIASLTATTYNGSYAISGGTKTVITVNINRHKIVTVGQSDLDAANSSEASLISFARQQGAALAVEVLTDVFTTITTANFSSLGATTTTAFGVSELRALRLALNRTKVPKTQRTSFLDVAVFDALLGVTNFVQAHMYGDAGAIREGQIPRAIGFSLQELVTGLPASVMAFAAHPSAIAIAMRYLQPQPGNTYADARALADPGTGLVMGLRDFYDNSTGLRYVVLEANYGYSAGLTVSGRIYKSLDQ